MSILAETYALCNLVQGTSARESVREAFKLATTPTGKDPFTGNDNGMLEYTARDQGAQFLSYLLASQERENFLNRNSIAPTSAMAYPSMAPENVEILENAHRALLDLNARCVAPVLAVTPNAERALNPYNSLLTYRFIAPKRPIDIIRSGMAKNLISAFAKHPAVQIAVETGSLLDNTMTNDDYLQAVLRMRESIINAGALAVPEGLTLMERDIPKGSRDHMLIRHIAALVSIAASLRVLNQHLFQSIVRDKPLVLTEDLLIDNKFPSVSNLVGQGRTLLYQVPQEHSIVEIFELLLLKVPTLKLDELCEVASWSRTFKYGHTLEIQVRTVDENLNPYPSLIQRI